jgi:nucleotide-binding universal stress UspA family protein
MSGPLLIGYDGSDDAAHAIACAGRALAPRPALVVHSFFGLSHMMLRSNVGVKDLDEPLAEAVKEFDTADAEEAERVAAEGAQLALAAGLEAQPIVVRQEGKPWQTLITVAEKHQAAAIVAGARGRSGLAAALLGSVSHGLAAHTPVPLLVAPAKADAQRRGPVLLAYDGSDHAKNAIEKAGDLLSERSALVLNVWHSWVTEVPVYLPGVAPEFDEIAAGLSADCADEGVGLAAAAGFDPKPLSVSTLRSPWHAVLDAVKQHDASVVVLGSRSLSGPSAILGSTATGVAHHTECPVLIVPPAGS